MSSLQGRVAKLERRQAQQNDSRDIHMYLSDVGYDGKLPYSRLEPTPAKEAAWAAWLAYRDSPEGIAEIVARERLERQEWERLHPGQPRPRRPWLTHGLTDKELIAVNNDMASAPTQPGATGGCVAPAQRLERVGGL